ncbi:hypothetical protein BRADI_3g57167v3 [Brachypodium distachyon]|uniref:Uncharacterized protein n=1 Tax=Brachypodium distachyon TaxID=15368 RepID=A0A2K2D5H6_BRADI|nr:hypothetical protein BRADI_3g57167v3 [Brachypodium distachyon]
MAFSIARAAASASARRSTTGLAGGAHLPELPHLNSAPSRRSVLVGAGSTWPPLRPRHGRASWQCINMTLEWCEHLRVR